MEELKAETPSVSRPTGSDRRTRQTATVPLGFQDLGGEQQRKSPEINRAGMMHEAERK